MQVSEHLRAELSKDIAQSTNEELYGALLRMIDKLAVPQHRAAKRKLYYLSAEFLIGKLLSNNLINLGIYEEVKALLHENGKQLSEIEALEQEPSLGNGGLGRLAACFLDSIATLGLNGDGIGLNYHFGLFRQVFRNNMQATLPDRWITDNSVLQRTDVVYPVTFDRFTLEARMYDIKIIGYHGRTNLLHLFDVERVDESLVGEDLSFDKTDIEKNLTLFLYPDDSDEAGRMLRIYQQYFLVSAAAQLILDECTAAGVDLHRLHEYAVIQINDTHPTMVIPELIRLLCARGIDMDEAIAIVGKTCAYTNHTILAEALEKWPAAYLQKAVPAIFPIIEALDERVRKAFADPALYIVDQDARVHMAHIDLHYCFSVNGVASLHTQILKQEELRPFYAVYPEKFNNKTNGISFRRWLMHANPQLAAYITSLIGAGWTKDAEELRALLAFRDDPQVLDALLHIKAEKKQELKAYLAATQGITLNAESIFDMQIKRLHEYKRQQMNALYVISKYLDIRAGKLPSTPITVLFGAKAAPAYVTAQDIIHLILCLQALICADDAVKPHLQVVMVENYNVTAAEKLIPACNISEQISLASKEASGTGNMKLMLNGAVTLGTEDGANVEIHQLVGDENMYVFGDSGDTVVARYRAGRYRPMDYYQADPAIARAVDFITDPRMTEIGNRAILSRLSRELKEKDWFMTFPDFADYVRTRERAYADYENRTAWAKKMLVNIARAGYFSSDRTIAEYNDEIWKL